jgi:indolepyruvate ferredoxin oxidoreductase
MPETLAGLMKRHVAFLSAYQNAAYARQYEALIDTVKQAEAACGQSDKLARAVAKSLFKLMTYKDEYEVARLYTDGTFIEKLKQQFDGKLRFRFHLAPPLFSKKNAQGNLVKSAYGSWIWQALRVLAKLKRLRGTKLDPFGWTAERRMERQLIVEYRELIQTLLDSLNADNVSQATEIAALALHIRGFGHVKDAAITHYRHKIFEALQHYGTKNILFSEAA